MGYKRVTNSAGGTPAGRLPVVLLPGLLCDRGVWSAPLAALRGRREAHVPDLSGHGTISTLAEAALAELPEYFDLVGFSMGGYVALRIFSLAPERVASLALIDTTARPDLPAASGRRRELVALAEREGARAAAAALVPVLVAEGHRKDPSVVQPWLDMAERIGVTGFASQQEAIIGRPDARPGLARIGCPTLIVHGELDTLAPPEEQLEMAAAISDARLEQIAGCGHLSLLEAPAAVSSLLAEWLLAPEALSETSAVAASEEEGSL